MPAPVDEYVAPPPATTYAATTAPASSDRVCGIRTVGLRGTSGASRPGCAGSSGACHRKVVTLVSLSGQGTKTAESLGDAPFRHVTFAEDWM